MGSSSFNRIQYGKENPATKGTAVACTNLFIGQMQPISSDRKPTFPVEHFGKRAESYRSVVHQRLYQNTLSTEHGAFQHLPLLGGGGLKGAVTPVEQTSGQGDYLWNFSPSMTSIDDIDSFSLRFGDDVQAWLAKYSVIERIRISGSVSQGQDASPVKIEADFFSQSLAETTYTAGLSEPTLEPLNAKFARLYLDSAWADVGETELDNLLRTFDIEIITGQKPKFAGSADETFNSHGGGVVGVMGTFGLEGGSDVNALLASQQNGSFLAARFDLPGSQIGSGVSHLLRIQFGGALETISPISGEDRGDNLAQIVLHGYFDPVADKLLDFSVITDRNTY